MSTLSLKDRSTGNQTWVLGLETQIEKEIKVDRVKGVRMKVWIRR